MTRQAILPLLLTLYACAPDEPKQPAPQDQAGQLPPPPQVSYAAVAKAGDAAIDAVADFIASQRIDKASAGWRTRLPKPPKVTFADGKKYVWKLKTNKGSIDVELLHDAAPMHVSSTIYLTSLGFYDGLTFHRVIKGFMAQGGDPLGDGKGGPGYGYEGEFQVRCKNAECGHEYFGTESQTVSNRKYFVCPQCKKLSAPALVHDRPGLLSMAHAGPGTDGSQFFLTFAPTPWLDGNHTIFGRVTAGHGVLETLEYLGSESGTPAETLLIESATIAVQD